MAGRQAAAGGPQCKHGSAVRAVAMTSRLQSRGEPRRSAVPGVTDRWRHREFSASFGRRSILSRRLSMPLLLRARAERLAGRRGRRECVGRCDCQAPRNRSSRSRGSTSMSRNFNGVAASLKVRPVENGFGDQRIQSRPSPGDPDFIPDAYATGVVVDRHGLILTYYHACG